MTHLVASGLKEIKLGLNKDTSERSHGKPNSMMGAHRLSQLPLQVLLPGTHTPILSDNYRFPVDTTEAHDVLVTLHRVSHLSIKQPSEIQIRIK